MKPLNVRTVPCEHGYHAVHCDGDVVAGVQCARTLGSVKKLGHRYAAFDVSGRQTGLLYSMDEAVAFIVRKEGHDD